MVKKIFKKFCFIIIILIILITASIIIYSRYSNIVKPKEASIINISFIPNPVLCENEIWSWKTIISIEGETVIDLKTFSRKIYKGNECLVTYVYDETQIEKWLSSAVLTASSPLSFDVDGSFPCQEMTHEIDIIEGIDENGNQIKSSGRIDFSF